MLQTEGNWFGRLVESIVADFPHLPRSHVQDCAEQTLSTFAGAKVRTYLPILVDRKVRLALCGRTGPEEAVGPGAGPVLAPRHGIDDTADVRMAG